MVLGIISVHYSRNIYLKINCIFNTLVLPTMYITNDLVKSLYFDFYSLTFCYATVIPLLIIFLTCTFVWPLNIIAVLGAGTKYHTLIDICEEKNCNLYTYCLMHYYLTCSKNHGTKQMNKRNLQTLVYIATVKRSLLQLSQMLFLLQSTYLRKIFFPNLISPSFLYQPIIIRAWNQLWEWKCLLQLSPTYPPLVQSKLHDYPLLEKLLFLESQTMMFLYGSIYSLW